MKMSTYNKLSDVGKKRADIVYTVENLICTAGIFAGVAVVINTIGFLFKVMGL